MIRGIIHLVLVIAALPACYFQPFAGLLIYLWFAHAHVDSFVFDEFRYISGSGFLLAMATIAGYIFFEMRYSHPRLRGMKLLLAFWAWLLISSLFASDRELALSKLWQYSSIFVMAFLVAALANSEGRIRKVFFALSVSLAMIGTKSALLYLFVAGHQVQAPGGMVSEENEYALALDLTIPILYWLARTEHRLWLRCLLYLMSVGCGITAIATGSRSGFLGLCVTLILIAVYADRKIVGISGLVLAAALILTLASGRILERYKTILQTEEFDQSVKGRLEAWETAVSVMKSHPFFGVGLRNFESEFAQYSNYHPLAAHNALLSLAAETGLPGVALFALVIWGASFRMFWLRWLLPDTAENAALRTYCLILHCDFLIFVVPNLFNTRQDYDLCYHLVGLAAGVGYVCEKRLFAAPLTSFIGNADNMDVAAVR